jgi:hypothetical protein
MARIERLGARAARLGMAGVGGEGTVLRGEGFGRAARREQRGPEAAPGVGVGGAEFDAAPQGREGLLGATADEQK